MERTALDIMGPLTDTKNGCNYIFMVQDYFMKWIEIFPMENMEGTTVANLLVHDVIARFGVPKAKHSDQGCQFEEIPFKEL